MDEDILSKVKKKHNEAREKKINKRISGEGDGTHLFIWTKRIIKILGDNSKLTEKQIADILLKEYPEDYELLSYEDITGSVKSVLKGLLKKPKLENLKGVNIDVIYGYGLKLNNNGSYWWIETIKEKDETRMKKILGIFKRD